MIQNRKKMIPLPIVKEANYGEAVALRDQIIWDDLANISLKQGVDSFLSTLEGHTQSAYLSAFNIFFKRGLLDPNGNLQTFALSNLEHLLDLIKQQTKGAEATKQARAAAFLSFTDFLQRKTGGMIKKALPQKIKGKKTFQKIRSEATSYAMTKEEVKRFLFVLKEKNQTYYLLAQMMLQGAKRVSEVLESEISQINWEEDRITFKQKKAEQLEKETVIHYPHRFMEELKSYLGGRQEGFVFLSKNKNQISRVQVFLVFRMAGKQAFIQQKISPHCLRATAITLFISKGYNTSQITKVSGHSDAKMVDYYDKSDKADNLTQELVLI